jgi:hypothetical protein
MKLPGTRGERTIMGDEQQPASQSPADDETAQAEAPQDPQPPADPDTDDDGGGMKPDTVGHG